MKAVTFQRFLSRPRLQRRKLHIFVPLDIIKKTKNNNAKPAPSARGEGEGA
jgi:hypothetical protein